MRGDRTRTSWSGRLIAIAEQQQWWRPGREDRPLNTLNPSLRWRPGERTTVDAQLLYIEQNTPVDRGVFYLEGAGFDDDFAPRDWSFHQESDRFNVTLAAERLPDLGGDFIITTYRSSAGDTPDTVRGHFERILPDYCRFLHACRENQMLLVSRKIASSSSFHALGAAAYMILSEIGGKPFLPMER